MLGSLQSPQDTGRPQKIHDCWTGSQLPCKVDRSMHFPEYSLPLLPQSKPFSYAYARSAQCIAMAYIIPKRTWCVGILQKELLLLECSNLAPWLQNRVISHTHMRERERERERAHLCTGNKEELVSSVAQPREQHFCPSGLLHLVLIGL